MNTIVHKSLCRGTEESVWAMDQGVPGSQNEHFFELLHPNSSRGSPPPSPPPPAVDAAADGSPPEDNSVLHAITPSYDFHLTHSLKPAETAAGPEDPLPGLPRASSLAPSVEYLQDSSFDASRGLIYGKPINASDAIDCMDRVTMDAIDRTIKQHTDHLMDVLQSVNGRLLKLETTVQGLEDTVAGLKFAEGEKQDQSNGRLMTLEFLIGEVNRGVQQLLHEKQREDEAKFHLAKLHLDDQKSAVGGLPQMPAEVWQQPKTAKEEVSQVGYSESAPQLPQHLQSQYPPPAQPHYPAPPLPQMQHFATSQSMIPLPSTMNGPPAANQQPYSPAMQHIPPQQQSTQGPQPPSQNSLQVPAFHSQPTPQLPPPSSYNVPVETPAYSHMQPQHHLPPPPAPPSSTYLPEPPHYTGGMHGGPRQLPMPQEVLHSSQQQSNPVGSQHMYDSFAGRMVPTASSMAPSYVPPSMPKPAPSVYETAGGGGGYGTPPYRASQTVPSAPSGGPPGYPRLPTAQPIQHGLPAANPISIGPSTRSPIDDVIDRVSTMGFPREQVRGVVRQLTDNKQSVDLNVVLDKLMNGGDSSQPVRGWFNRS